MSLTGLTVAGRLDPRLGVTAPSNLQLLSRTIWLVFAGGIALALLSGCMAQASVQLEREARARKAESLKGWESVTLDGAPILEALFNRTPSLWRNAEFGPSKNPDQDLSAKLNEKSGLASAVPITGDGYFLTAAHTLRDAETLDVVFSSHDNEGRPKIKSATARIVWKPEDEFGSGWNRGDPKLLPDFAILHADVDPLMPFRLSSELRIDEPVLGAGWSIVQEAGSSSTVQLTAGHVLSVQKQDPPGASIAWLIVLHDAPVIGGDSGGPLLNRSGDLVGINCKSRLVYSFWAGVGVRLGRVPEDYERSSVAILPDPDWIGEVIDQDRQNRNAGPDEFPGSESELKPTNGHD